MNTTAYARKSAREADADAQFAEGAALRSQRWSDRLAGHRPVAARHDVEHFDAVAKRPANDEFSRSHAHRVSPRFSGSRYFWAAAVATVAFCLLFAVVMGLSSRAALESLLRSPQQFSLFLLSIVVIAAIQWMLAMSAHRQAVNQEMWRRVMALTQRANDPSPSAEEAGRNLSMTLERVAADLDSRMSALDARTEALVQRIGGMLQQSEASADMNIAQMRGIVEAGEAQKDALQRIGVTISTEILPVINKLETTVASLESVSHNAGGVLGAVGEQLQQSTRELHSCLDDFNRANHTVAPEIEKRVARFEALMTRLPDQLEATLSRLDPMSETIADAAMLSTANVEVMEQLGKDITGSLQKNRAMFKEFSEEHTGLFQQAIEGHAEHFRGLLSGVINEEVARISSLSRELCFLADTATSLVEKLQQPVEQVSSTANKALDEMNHAVLRLDEKMQSNLSSSVAQLNQAASQVVSGMSREIEAATIALQTRIAASSNDLVNRVNSDTGHFERLIADVAREMSERVTAAIGDLPTALSQRLESEIAKVDGTLKGSIVGLSDQMRTIIDGIPSRLTTMTKESLLVLEGSFEKSFQGVAQRSAQLNDLFRKNATETTEAVLENYVDFIFLALKRFRSEMEVLNGNLQRELETTLKALPPAKEGEEPQDKDDTTAQAPQIKPLAALRLPTGGV